MSDWMPRSMKFFVLVGVALCATVISNLANAQQTFDNWYNVAIRDKESVLYKSLLAERKVFKERIPVEGIAPLIAELSVTAAELMPDEEPGFQRAEDAENIRKLVHLLDEVKSELDIDAAQVKRIFSEEKAGTNTDDVVTELISVQTQRQITNLFGGMDQRTTKPNAGSYVIAKGRKNEILIPPKSTSSVDRSIWRIGLIAQYIIGAANLPLMEATNLVIAQARDDWKAFMENAVGDQFVWETIFNSWAANHLPPIAGTLSTPPRFQLRIVHPTPVVVYSTLGGIEAEPRLAVELFGVRRFGRDYAPNGGVSLIGIFPSDRDQGTGWGLLLTRKRFSFGITKQEFNNGEDIVALVFGIDLAAQLQNQQGGLRERIDNKLSHILESLARGHHINPH